MTPKAADFLVYDKAAGVYRENPEQLVRDDVEKHAWRHIGMTILKDWRLYLMLVPMLLVFLFWRYFPMYELLRCFKESGITAFFTRSSAANIPVTEKLSNRFERGAIREVEPK